MVWGVECCNACIGGVEAFISICVCMVCMVCNTYLLEKEEHV